MTVFSVRRFGGDRLDSVAEPRCKRPAIRMPTIASGVTTTDPRGATTSTAAGSASRVPAGRHLRRTSPTSPGSFAPPSGRRRSTDNAHQTIYSGILPDAATIPGMQQPNSLFRVSRTSGFDGCGLVEQILEVGAFVLRWDPSSCSSGISTRLRPESQFRRAPSMSKRPATQATSTSQRQEVQLGEIGDCGIPDNIAIPAGPFRRLPQLPLQAF